MAHGPPRGSSVGQSHDPREDCDRDGRTQQQQREARTPVETLRQPHGRIAVARAGADTSSSSGCPDAALVSSRQVEQRADGRCDVGEPVRTQRAREPARLDTPTAGDQPDPRGLGEVAAVHAVVASAPMVGRDEDGRSTPTCPHPTERREQLPEDGVRRSQRPHVAAVVAAVRVLVGLSETEEHQPRALRLEVVERDRGGRAVGPEVAVTARVGIRVGAAVEQLARDVVLPERLAVREARTSGGQDEARRRRARRALDALPRRNDRRVGREPGVRDDVVHHGGDARRGAVVVRAVVRAPAREDLGVAR